MYWGSCLQSVTVLRAAKAAEISNQMPCVPPLEEALLSARVEVTCTSVLTLNAVLATSLTMTRYFGELSNAERTTPPPKRRHTAKKEEKKKKKEASLVGWAQRSASTPVWEKGWKECRGCYSMQRERVSMLAFALASWRYGNKAFSFFYLLE